ncbi:hypothetical protein U8607_12280 [Methylobacterium durans]|nr:hypothetical protein [Methylobacterium durans]MEA1832860.1 hypothetical protein [Methylobacterium durans]
MPPSEPGLRPLRPPRSLPDGSGKAQGCVRPDPLP